ncbi:MAG: sigma-70 family RNA polymerase sigma factor, partial [Planctomycetales bacterium]|nr:sigma-70 family RNA polymerase sigma factor [Planctomycetales bacterium]
QETFVMISRRMDDFLARRPTSFRLWSRLKAMERLIDLRREHYADKRNVRRQVTLSNASSLALSRRFLKESPSQLLENQERANRIRAAIECLKPIDREVLLLRHVEELSNAEVAEVLEMHPDTASKRYGRAVIRLAEKLAEQESQS